MKQRLLQLLELFTTARTATKITLALSTLAIFAVAGVSSWFATRPDLVQLWSGLSAAEAAEYKRALATAGIAFRSSPPPENGIWVDISEREDAEAQVALGGFTPSSKGILVTDGGMDSAFLSARTRDQMAEKREWQECELQLERLAFIENATVCSSSQDHSAFGSSEDATISVTLGLRHGYALDDSQARTVATLVRSRFNVPLENITVVDEQGNLLHDGAGSSSGFDGNDLYAFKRRYDNDAERRANRSLEMALGKGMARATVNSVWTYQESESIRQQALPKDSAAVFTSKSTSEGGGSSVTAGGPAGVSSNITQDFGVENAAPGSGTASAGPSKSSDEVTRNVVGQSTEYTTSRTPQITRMSVALIADDSVAEDLAKLEGLVKAAVGFSEERQDYFESFTTPLASIERDEDGAPILPTAEEPVAPPNPYMQLAIEHGVEVFAALAFIIVLLKSLKSVKESRKEAEEAGSGRATATAARPTGGGSGGANSSGEIDLHGEDLESIDPELLARAQVEDLVRNDPERVSAILANWASATDEKVGAGS